MTKKIELTDELEDFLKTLELEVPRQMALDSKRYHSLIWDLRKRIKETENDKDSEYKKGQWDALNWVLTKLIGVPL